jgi:hypothetical protein
MKTHYKEKQYHNRKNLNQDYMTSLDYKVKYFLKRCNAILGYQPDSEVDH